MSLTLSFNRQNSLEGVLINSIRPYEEGRWLIANNLGTQTFDGRSFTPLQIDGEPFAEYTVDVLQRFGRGRLWIGTIGRGLFLRENGEWRQTSVGATACVQHQFVRWKKQHGQHLDWHPIGSLSLA